MEARENQRRFAPSKSNNDQLSGSSRPSNDGGLFLPPAKNQKPLPVVSTKPGPDIAANDNVAVNPDFTLVRSDYRVRLASEDSHLHTRAGKLVSSMYGSRGLMTDGSLCVDTPLDQVTLAASSGNRVFGALTLGVDSGKGLLADALYRSEIDELRTGGRQMCEVTRLALDPQLSCPEVMATMFNVALVLAKGVYQRTDLIAEVHPRHAGFYQRTLGYRVVGPERICARVSAPAVLMRLCLDFATDQIRKLAGISRRGERSLYRLFLPPAEQKMLLKKLTITVSSDS